MINQILFLISSILAAIGFGYFKGKRSIELKDNENAAKQIQEKNKYVNDVRKLSDVELDKRVRKYTKRSK